MFCILCGCDYLKNPHKVGIKKAYTIFNNNLRQPKFVFNYLRSIKVENVDMEYMEQFERAYLTFKYQRVWCPIKQKMVSLNSLNDLDLFDDSTFSDISISNSVLIKDVGNFVEKSLLIKHSRRPQGLSFLGPILQQDLLQEIAECKRDPITKELFKAPQSFESTITDVKFDQLRSMAFNMRKTESSTLPGVCQLTFKAKSKTQCSGQSSLTSFFAVSQETSMNILKRSKDIVTDKSINRMDIEHQADDDISDDDDDDRPVFGDVGQMKGGLASQKTQGVSFSSATAASKGQATVSQMFKRFEVEENKSIVTETMANFRNSYLDTMKKLK